MNENWKMLTCQSKELLTRYFVLSLEVKNHDGVPVESRTSYRLSILHCRSIVGRDCNEFAIHNCNWEARVSSQKSINPIKYYMFLYTASRKPNWQKTVFNFLILNEKIFTSIKRNYLFFSNLSFLDRHVISSWMNFDDF